MAPRRARQRQRSPSPGPIEVDMTRHICLRFPIFAEEARYQFLSRKRIQDVHHLDWQPLIALNIRSWLVDRIPTQWTRLLTTTSRQYRELILEFYTTYEMATEITDVDAQIISFRMRGQEYTMSLSQFAIHMRIYQEDELPGRIGSEVPISDEARNQLWTHLTGIPLYDSSTYKASHIRDPRIRILHRIIATAFFGRWESVGNVTHGDLNIMHALLNKQFLCPARLLAEELTKMSGKLSNQAIAGGAFITRLAIGLGVDLEDMSVVGRNLPLTMVTLRNMKVIGSDRGRTFLTTANGEEWIPPPADEDVSPEIPQFTSPEIRRMLGTSPLGHQAGPSRVRSPPRAEHHSPPPYASSSSYQPHDHYYPPRSYYDDLSARMGHMEVTQTQLWESHQRQTALQDQRWEDTQSWFEQHTYTQDQRWDQTQSFFQQQESWRDEQRQQWTRQEEMYARQEDMWARFIGTQPPQQPPPDP